MASKNKSRSIYSSDGVLDYSVDSRGNYVYNKYEKRVMFPLKVMKILTVLIIAVNLLLPVYKDYKLGFVHIITYIFIGIYLIALASGLGYIYDKLPLLPITLLRTYQGLTHWFWWDNKLNVIPFIILVVCDLIYFIYFIIDANNYKYIEVSEYDNSEQEGF